MEFQKSIHTFIDKSVFWIGAYNFLFLFQIYFSCLNTIFFRAVLVANKKCDKGTSCIYARIRVRKDNTTVSEKTEKTKVSIQSCLLHQPAVRLERDVAEKELPLKVGICRRWAQVKYSTHSTAQRYVYVLSHLFSLPIPGFFPSPMDSFSFRSSVQIRPSSR